MQWLLSESSLPPVMGGKEHGDKLQFPPPPNISACTWLNSPDENVPVMSSHLFPFLHIFRSSHPLSLDFAWPQTLWNSLPHALRHLPPNVIRLRIFHIAGPTPTACPTSPHSALWLKPIEFDYFHSTKWPNDNRQFKVNLPQSTFVYLN